MEYSKMTVRDFIRELESSSATPGGGAAAALGGAMAGSLCTMAVSVTLGREAYRDAWTEMESIAGEVRSYTALLLELMDEDPRVYGSVIQATRMPKTTEVEKEVREACIQKALKAACHPPLEILRTVAKIARLLESLLFKGNPNALADLGTAAELLSSASKAAAYSLEANLKRIEDASFKEEILGEFCYELSLVSGSALLAEKEMTNRLE